MLMQFRMEREPHFCRLIDDVDPDQPILTKTAVLTVSLASRLQSSLGVPHARRR